MKLYNEGEYEKLIEVHMNEFAITDGNDIKPLITTYGSGSCLSIMGIEKNLNMAFIGHFSSIEKFKEILSEFFFNILKYKIEEKPLEFEITCFNGNPKWTGKYFPEMIRLLSTINKDKIKVLKYNILERDNFLIDTRTLNQFEYDVKRNPISRKFFPDLDNVKIIYNPKNPHLNIYK